MALDCSERVISNPMWVETHGCVSLLDVWALIMCVSEENGSCGNEGIFCIQKHIICFINTVSGFARPSYLLCVKLITFDLFQIFILNCI